MARHSRRTTDDWQRDPRHRVVSLGIVTPALLTVWMLLNVTTGQAAWPVLNGRRLTVVWVDDSFRVWMAGLVKFGIATACFGWYYMANHEEWFYIAQPVTVVGCAAAVAAFVIGSLQFVL